MKPLPQRKENESLELPKICNTCETSLPFEMKEYHLSSLNGSEFILHAEFHLVVASLKVKLLGIRVMPLSLLFANNLCGDVN